MAQIRILDVKGMIQCRLALVFVLPTKIKQPLHVCHENVTPIDGHRNYFSCSPFPPHIPSLGNTAAAIDVVHAISLSEAKYMVL